MKRLDTADKVNGTQVYSIDLKLPGMLHAAIKACPVFGGKFEELRRVEDRGPARRRRRRPGGRCDRRRRRQYVVAGQIGARRAADRVGRRPQRQAVERDDRGAPGRGLDVEQNAFADINDGDAPQAIAGAAKKIEAVYSTPFLSHACMEPMNCTVRITADKAEVWMPSQNAEASLAALSSASGLPLAQCEAYNHGLGGGFGRRGGTQDFVRQAVAIAKRYPGRPVKMVWTREEDQAHDFYRPISQCKLSAGLDQGGNLVGLHIRVSGQSINAWLAPHNIKDGKDVRQLQGLWKGAGDAQIGYTVPNLHDRVRDAQHARAGRAVARRQHQPERRLPRMLHGRGGASGRKDPLEFRRALMKNHPKHLAVLNAAAEKGGLGQAAAGRSPSRHRAVHGIWQLYGGRRGGLGERQRRGQGPPHGAGDQLRPCGQSGNDRRPGRGLGGVRLRFAAKRDLDRERAGRGAELPHLSARAAAQLPKIETVIVPTYDFWGGVGEPTICVTAPAVLNAIYAATGKPVRTLPIKNHGLTLV